MRMERAQPLAPEVVPNPADRAARGADLIRGMLGPEAAERSRRARRGIGPDFEA